MSEPPANESESAAAPSGSGKGSSLWWVGAVTVPVLYVLSVGPAAWLYKHGYLPEWVGIIYAPLEFLPEIVRDFFVKYVELWVN